ncbi:MAG: phosphotransacetylase [Endomicrobium sp.]|nr:phosphotransacetylase [Endomicrobium sp.]
MNIRRYILELARKKKGKIIMPEGFDVRVLKAAQKLAEDDIASVILPTDDVKKIKKIADEADIDLRGVEVVKMERDILDKEKVREFVDVRTRKGMTKEKVLNFLKNPLYFSMMYLKSGNCDACVGGAVYDTADVLRAAIHVIGTAENIKMISSYFLMIPPEGHSLAKDPIVFADCAVNPDPQAMALKDIAIATVESFKKLFPGKQANVAMLSFSTKGSANNKILLKVQEATELVRSHFVGRNDINVDGELQFDAAVVPSIGKKKSPDSLVAGNANIFIFPELNASNIGYKIAERYGGFQAIGPVIQGLALPASDLSRGSTSDDIYLISAVMLLG